MRSLGAQLYEFFFTTMTAPNSSLGFTGLVNGTCGYVWSCLCLFHTLI